MIGRRRARAVPPPAAPPAAAWAGVLAALLLAGVAVLAVQNAVVHAGWVSAPSWAGAAAAHLDGAAPRNWWAAAGSAAVVLGLVLLAAAVAPRRRTGIRIPAPPKPGGNGARGEDPGAGEDAAAPVWARPADLARMAGDAARGVPQVTAARAEVTRRRITVTASTDDPASDAVRAAVDDAVRTRLAPLAGALPLSVRIHRRQVHR